MSRSGVAWVRAGALSATFVLPLALLAGCSPRSSAPPTSSSPPASAAGGASASPSTGMPASTATPSPYAYPTLPPPPPNSIDTLTMLTAETGWAQRSLDGAVLHTTHGVQHWLVATPQLSGGQRIVAVAFVSAGSARVITAGGLSSNADAPPVSMTFTSWATDDGGARWSRGGILSVVQDPGSSWTGALDFINPIDGWFSANEDDIDASLGTTLFRTVDGGSHWEEVAHLTQSSTSASAVPCYAQPTATFISPTTGWLTGGGCATTQFEVTHNGGATWSPQPIPLLGTPYLWLASPTFITSQEGVMLGSDPSEQPGVVLYLTFDGGRIWTAHGAPGISPHAVDFIGAHNIWLLSSNTMNAGFAAGLYVTHDGGQIWTTLQPLDNGPPIRGPDLNGAILDFVSATLGWTDTIIGDSEAILQTTDGGHTWKPVTVQVTG